MNLPLDTGEELIDRGKSTLYLYYLAKATQRQLQRDIAHRKVELSIKQLKKISTKALQKNIDELEAHVSEAMSREKELRGFQKEEEKEHTGLKNKITRLEGKLDRYLETQEARKKRMQELEDKITHKFETKKQRIAGLREDLKRAVKLYQSAKKAKADKTKLQKAEKRIRELMTRIEKV